MSFERLPKPMGDDTPMEADHLRGIHIDGMDGTPRFRLQVMTLTHPEFEEMGKVIQEKVIEMLDQIWESVLQSSLPRSH